MQENGTGGWLARDGDGRVLEVNQDGHPGAEADPDDGRPIAESADRAWDRQGYVQAAKETLAGIKARGAEANAAGQAFADYWGGTVPIREAAADADREAEAC